MCRSALLVFLLSLALTILASPSIRIERVPDSGIQPRLLNDPDGGVHLLYFQRVKTTTSGTRRRSAGELYYRKMKSDGQWSIAIQVSPTIQHNDAIGKAAFSIDEQKRIHVVWFTSNPLGYWYSRSDQNVSSFDVARNMVVENLIGVEAEASIATFQDRVTISWHAGDMRQESKRQVYSITSTDNGSSFGREIAVSAAALGACACCSLATKYQSNGNYLLAYRSAVDNTGRHMQLLVASDGPDNSQTITVSKWQLNTCPVSSNDMKGKWLVFETEGKIEKYNLSEGGKAMQLSDTDGERQKHPAIAVNDSNYYLISWGEGAGYFTGGKLKLALFDSNNKTHSTPDTGGFRIPYYSVAAVAATGNGNFIVLY